MSSNPHVSTMHPESPEITNRGREPNASIDPGIKQGTLVTELLETSNNDIQSLVIVKDINVEEELIKAEKVDKNYFKALSMSFYGKGKSRSVDSPDIKDKFQVNTPQSEFQPSLFKKMVSQTPSDTKRHAFHRPKNKSQGQMKKNISILKEFYMIPEQFRKRFSSPREDLRKMCTPLLIGKKEQKDDSPSKTKAEKEISSYVSSQQRVQTLKNPDMSPETEENKLTQGSCMKTTSVGRSNSPKKKSSKKKSTGHMPKKPVTLLSEAEDRLTTFNIVPSLLEMELQKVEEALRKKNRNPSPDVSSKGGYGARKQSEKNKSISTPTKSTKSLPSTANSQLKMSRSESQEVKKSILEDVKFSMPNGDTFLTQGIETRKAKEKPQKTRSQDMKRSIHMDERHKNLSLMDFQDSDNEDGLVRLETLPLQEFFGKKIKKTSSDKMEKQRSPLGVKLGERIPTMTSSGMGNWEMRDMLIGKKDINLKLKSKEPSQSSMSPETKYKSKPNSVEKLSRADISEHWDEYRIDDKNRKRTFQTPKFEVYRPKDDRTMKIFEVYGQPKEKKDKSRPMSPAIGEFQKAFNLFGKFATKNRKDKL